MSERVCADCGHTKADHDSVLVCLKEGCSCGVAHPQNAAPSNRRKSVWVVHYGLEERPTSLWEREIDALREAVGNSARVTEVMLNGPYPYQEAVDPAPTAPST